MKKTNQILGTSKINEDLYIQRVNKNKNIKIECKSNMKMTFFHFSLT